MVPWKLAVVALLAVVLAPAAPSRASVVYAGPDRNLVQGAGAIVVGTVLDATPRFDPETGLIETIARVSVEQVLKGSIETSEIRVAEWGGMIGDRWMVASGAPRYEPGERSLMFLERNRLGDWATLAMSLGRFRFERDSAGRNVLVRDEEGVVDIGSPGAGEPGPGRVRLADDFLDWVRDVARGEAPRPDYFAAASADRTVGADALVTPDFVGSQYAMTLAGLPIRRENASVAWRIWGSQPGLDLPLSVSRGASAWSSGGSSKISYSRSSQPATGDFVADDGESRIIADDPTGSISGSCYTGTCTVAVCYFGGAGVHEFNGESFLTLVTSDVMVNDGVEALGQLSLDTALTHELGHSLGFRHSNKTPDGSGNCGPPLPCSTTAIMNSSVVPGIGSSLQSWDIEGVRTLYGSAATCTAPVITAAPKPVTVISGSSTTLTLGFAGTAPVSIQWYRGARGDRSAPVGTGTATLSTGPMTVTTSYWAEMTNKCGSVQTETITVTVCDPPVITSQPAGASIRAGQTATLSIGVSGASTIQWYRGAAGDVSHPAIGANSTVFVTPPLTSTALFWARAANSCTAVSSTSARVDVCVPPQIAQHPASETVRRGDPVTLSVTPVGSEPLTYAWYEGVHPDTSRPVGTGNPFVTAPIASQSAFWVLVSNGCGSANSVTAIISVAEECIPPSIARDPAGQSIAIGGSAILSVAAEGTGLNYQWYRGASGDRTAPVGINSSAIVTESLAETTSFWVRVSNACGERNSATAVVSAVPCEAPRMAVQPRSTTIDSGGHATLFASASGEEPMSYQWFEGASGDVTYPVGGDSPSFTTPTLVRTTDYWVRATNGCSSVDSVTANVLVLGGHPRGRGVKR